MPQAPDDYRALVRQIAYEQAKLSTSAFFFTGEDALRLRTFGSVPSTILALEGRMLGPEGRIAAFAHAHTPSSDRTVVTSLHGLGEGFLLNVSLRASTGTPRVGQVFAVLEVVRGLTGAVQPLACLVEGYVTDTQRLAWPGGGFLASCDGPGVIRAVTGTDPAAGVEIAEAVPTNARWRLRGLGFTLTCDATAANRTPHVALDDGTNPIARFGALAAVTASSTVRFSASGHGFASVSSSTDQSIALPPDVVLQGGMRLTTLTTNLQAGDNYGAPLLLVEEWIED